MVNANVDAGVTQKCDVNSSAGIAYPCNLRLLLCKRLLLEERFAQQKNSLRGVILEGKVES